MHSWESSKENIKPLKCGRSLNAMASSSALARSNNSLAVQDPNLPPATLPDVKDGPLKKPVDNIEIEKQ